MKLYQTCYNGCKFEVSETIKLNEVNEDLFFCKIGYFSNILVYPECIKEMDSKYNAKLDVTPIGQLSNNIINIFKEDVTEQGSILVVVDANKLTEEMKILSSKNKPLVIVHSETCMDTLIEDRPNFPTKIYEIEKGEKLFFRVKDKTIFIIDNTKDTPQFINIG